MGYARLWEPVTHVMLYSFGNVHPAHTGNGLGSLLLASIEKRAQDHLTDAGGEPVTLRSFVDLKDERGCVLLSEAGFEGIRRHYTMTVKLGEEEIDLRAPEGIVIRESSLDEAPLVHALMEESFAEHWGHVPMSFEEWSEMVLKRSDLDPSLWFVAEAGSEPIGVLVGFGEGTRGWVNDLGVRSGWRRRGVAASLLRRCFAEFRRRGYKEVGLGVDAGNETGAVALYESVGMQPVRVYEVYEKRLLPQ